MTDLDRVARQFLASALGYPRSHVTGYYLRGPRSSAKGPTVLAWPRPVQAEGLAVVRGCPEVYCYWYR